MRRAILVFIITSGVAYTRGAPIPALSQVAVAAPSAWQGVVRDIEGRPAESVTIKLQDGHTSLSAATPPGFTALSNASGAFSFPKLPAGEFILSVRWHDRELRLDRALHFNGGERANAAIIITRDERGIEIYPAAVADADGTDAAQPGNSLATGTPASGVEQSTGGANLSARQVSNLPLNKRDFSQLLTLAAGTTTDANGASNFTQQFAVNGQRGTAAVFAIDGVDPTDPELGGATFANFNVDAIDEIRSDSGVMPAGIGEGAAAFTNVITKSGGAKIHGDWFEFLRNSSLDARNFFDRRSAASSARLPPFRRNEFGFTNGGPVVLPGVYDGRHRTFYFGEYQGFRQVLSTTQVLSVPSLAERQGLDTSAFRGDTLIVPVSPKVRPALDAYPLPNDPATFLGVSLV